LPRVAREKQQQQWCEVYITRQQAQKWDAEQLDWRAIAIRNLCRDTGDFIATHEKRTNTGRLLWFALMHNDGLGSSRLLLHQKVATEFPQGYWLAIPERSCGLIVSKAMTADELNETETLISNCYENGTTAMSDRLFEPEELAIPESWFSQI
jgi:hypothetical protein